MANLFEHTDHDGDHLSVDSWPVFNDDQSMRFNYLIVKNTEGADNDPRPGAVSVRLNAVDVNRLHAALGAWMADNGITARSATSAPVADPDSLYGDLIRQAVAAEVARVLPLHQAPMALGVDCTEPLRPGTRVSDLCGACGFIWGLHRGPMARCRRCGVSANEPHTDCSGDARACQYILPGAPGYDLLADPEPHDVGHPVYEDARPHPCGVCNRPWSDGHGQPGDPCRPVNTDPAPGLLGATLPVDTSHCPDCGHGWNDHTVGVCWGSGACPCRAKQPAPVPVTESDKVWGEQGTPPVECTCEHDRQMHGQYGCGWMGGCTCKWIGTSS